MLPERAQTEIAVTDLLEQSLSQYRAGNHDLALARVAAAIDLEPQRADALNLQGVILNAAGRPAEAVASIERAIEAAPDNVGIVANLGMALRSAGRLDEAWAAYDRVLTLDPEYAPAYVNRGAVLFDLHRYAAALSDYDKALTLRPEHAETIYRRGVVLGAMGRLSEAILALDRALELRPGLVDALIGRGDCRRKLGQVADALADYRAAFALRPNDPTLPGLVLRQQMKLSDWADFDRQRAELSRRVAAGTTQLGPFASLSTLIAPDLQLKAARDWNARRMPAAAAALPATAHAGPIRLGYFSADFNEGHPTMLLMAEMLARHDRGKFHVTGFHFNLQGKPDTNRYATLFDAFVGLDGRSDIEAAALARDRKVDIAIDVDGFTRDSRPRIFAHRAAPVQVSYLAYAGTLGVGHIDYLVADPTLIGSADTNFYSEKIAWLPHSYQPRDTRILPDETPTRAEAGLPETGFVFCCFNNNYKITPDVFSAWMTILSRVPGSVLWLLAERPRVIFNLRREAQARGIDPARLIFAAYVPIRRHLARLRLAGLVLDTLPYNAHTTASDALFAGVPLLTRPGDTFASRVGASLLTTLGLPELIAGSGDDYVERAVEIGTNPTLAAALREKLADQVVTSPLFDMERYARDLEAAYLVMIERARAGLPAESFAV